MAQHPQNAPSRGLVVGVTAGYRELFLMTLSSLQTGTVVFYLVAALSVCEFCYCVYICSQS